MALPTSGSMTMGNINVELGIARATQRSLGQSTTRSLYGVPSGAIRLAADGYGKSAVTVLVTTTGLNMYGSFSKYSYTVPSDWDNNSYWAVLNSNPNIMETSYCQGYPTLSFDLCIGNWGSSLSPISNPSYSRLTKVEFYNSSGGLVQTINKSSFTTYYSGEIAQTCVRIPGVSSSLYYGASPPEYTPYTPISGTTMKWYWNV